MEKRKGSAGRQRIKSRVSLIILSTLAVVLLGAVIFQAVERALGAEWLPPAPTAPEESDAARPTLPAQGEVAADFAAQRVTRFMWPDRVAERAVKSPALRVAWRAPVTATRLPGRFTPGSV